jgi:hypothetical protein
MAEAGGFLLAAGTTKYEGLKKASAFSAGLSGLITH